MKTNQNNMICIDRIRPGDDVGVKGFLLENRNGRRKMVKNAGLDNSDQYRVVTFQLDSTSENNKISLCLISYKIQ